MKGNPNMDTIFFNIYCRQKSFVKLKIVLSISHVFLVGKTETTYIMDNTHRATFRIPNNLLGSIKEINAMDLVKWVIETL